MADIDLKDVTVHGGVRLPFAPGSLAEAAEAAPAPTRSNPYGGLSLTLTSPPEATGLAIDYAVVDGGQEVRRDTQELAFSGKFDAEGRKIWNLLSMPVPHGAQVRFRVRYEIGGQALVHDDGGQEFVAAAE